MRTTCSGADPAADEAAGASADWARRDAVQAKARAVANRTGMENADFGGWFMVCLFWAVEVRWEAASDSIRPFGVKSPTNDPDMVPAVGWDALAIVGRDHQSIRRDDGGGVTAVTGGQIAAAGQLIAL